MPDPLPVVHVVHCIDTEGPLHEPLSATFDRIKDIFGLDLDPTLETLRKLQTSQMDLGGLEHEVAKVVSSHLLGYNATWDAIDKMLEDMLAPQFRNIVPDSFGNGWVYNWHCLDHVGFTVNPRRRDMGFHNVFDHYVELQKLTRSAQDGIHFHHHPVPFSREAHRCATHYFAHTPMIFEILARRIVDRLWFPCVYRPGFHTTRPDSHWFLEQFIPFEYANQATDEDYSAQQDISAGRYGDWRRAPKTWTPYHPDHDDYQTTGACRRWIARCLNVGTRTRLIQESDVELAFQEARSGRPAILSFTNHDFRDMRPDVERMREMIAGVARRHPDVRYRYCEGRDAMRSALQLDQAQPFELNLSVSARQLNVSCATRTFGPQPFLAIKTKSGQYFHDNLDFQEPFKSWTYTFDDHTFPLDAVECIGVGACDATGQVSVKRLNLATGECQSNAY